MKVNSFKIREIDGKVAEILTDKQAGELYKAICAYNFHGAEYNGKDPIVKCVYSHMRNTFEKDEFFKETGKLGGVKSANMKREPEIPMPCIGKAVIGGDIIGEVLKGLFDDLDKPQKRNADEGLKS